MPKKNDITQEPFTPYREEQERVKAKDSGETFTIWVSAKERAWLDQMKPVIHQPKDSTALKQLAKIGGAYLLGKASPGKVLDVVFKNKRRNRRSGVPVIT